jgi:hypothetical protein
MKRLHICIFNHDRIGVADQVDALTEMLEEHTSITVSDDMEFGVDNLLIENFNVYQINEIRKHQARSDHRLFVLLTEHLELDTAGTLRLNEQLWSEKREYIPTLYPRFLSLVELSDVIDGFLVLYGAPQKNAIKTVFKSMPMFDLAEFKCYPFDDSSHREYDFCFIGSTTKYREYVIGQLRRRFTVFSSNGISNDDRQQIIKLSRFTLNIPQHTNWTNISPMRVISSARGGAHVINVTEAGAVRFPYVTTISLPELLALNMIEIRDRCFINERSQDKLPSQKSDFGQFIQWIS